MNSNLNYLKSSCPNCFVSIEDNNLWAEHDLTYINDVNILNAIPYTCYSYIPTCTLNNPQYKYVQKTRVYTYYIYISSFESRARYTQS